MDPHATKSTAWRSNCGSRARIDRIAGSRGYAGYRAPLISRYTFPLSPGSFTSRVGGVHAGGDPVHWELASRHEDMNDGSSMKSDPDRHW